MLNHPRSPGDVVAILTATLEERLGRDAFRANTPGGPGPPLRGLTVDVRPPASAGTSVTPVSTASSASEVEAWYPAVLLPLCLSATRKSLREKHPKRGIRLDRRVVSD